jgi:hypothetical protein
MGARFLGKADDGQPLARPAHLAQQRGDGAAIVMHQQQAGSRPSGDEFHCVLKRFDVKVAPERQWEMAARRRTSPSTRKRLVPLLKFSSPLASG